MQVNSGWREEARKSTTNSTKTSTERFSLANLRISGLRFVGKEKSRKAFEPLPKGW